jgi:hypothetical protein
MFLWMSPEQESYDHVIDHTKLVTSIKKLERSVLFERDVSKKKKQAIAPSTISSKILPTPLMWASTMLVSPNLTESEIWHRGGIWQ